MINMKDHTYKDFPTTRYQGSKRQLLPWIGTKMSGIEFDTVLDVFGGTGAVSYLMKTMGKRVSFNDYLKSNSISAKALIRNNRINLYPDELEILFTSDREGGVVTRVFNGLYFTDEENMVIDTLMRNIHSKELKFSGTRRYLALYALFQALMMKRPFNLFHRANLYIREADIERSFGNKTTWDRPILELMERNLTEANNAIFYNNEKHTVLNKDALKLENGFDLIYLDPPYYTTNYKYVNYRDYYHFLEGLCDYDNWEKRIDYSRRSLPLKKRKSSFKKQTFVQDLEDLLSIHRESIIVLSYKSPGYPSIKELRKIIAQTHKRPTVRTKEHSYSLNKNNGHYRENLIIATPRD